MQWNNFGEFLDMGGYAPFVWTSLGACVLAILIELAQLSLRRRKAEQLGAARKSRS